MNATTAPSIVDLQEFQDDSVVHLEGFSSLNYSMPQFIGDNFTMTSGAFSNLAFPPANTGAVDFTLDGTAGPTALAPQVGVANVEFTNITNVNISTGFDPVTGLPDPVGQTNDTLTVDVQNGFSDGLQNLGVYLGPGSDTLNVIGSDLALPVSGGAFVYDGGTDVFGGIDTINVAGDADWTLTNSGITSSAGGSIQFLNNSVENAVITGGDSANKIEVDSWSGTATLNGLGGDDIFNIGPLANTVVTGAITISGGDGNDTINVENYTGVGDFSGDSGDDIFNIDTDTITLSAAATGTGTISAYLGTGLNLTTTKSSKAAKVSSTVGLAIGQAVIGPNVPANTTITQIFGSTLTLSQAATATGTAATLIGIVGTPTTPGANIFQITITTTTGSQTANPSGAIVPVAGQTIISANTAANTQIGQVSNLTLDGGDGNNTFNVHKWYGSGTLTGGDGNNTFNVGNAGTTVRANFTMTAGNGDNTFDIASWSGSGDLTSGSGNDTFNWGWGNTKDVDTVTASHNVNAGGGTNSLNLDSSGSSAVENYTITQGTVSDNSTFGGISFLTTIQLLKWIGSQGANTFSVTPSTGMAINVDGQNPTTTPGDVLNIDFTSTKGARLTPNGPNGGTISFTSGHKPITYSNFETVPAVAQVSQQQQQQQKMATILQILQNDPLLVAGPDAGSGSKPLVQVFDASTNALIFSFYAYEQTFTGGVRVSETDVNGDGVPDIIVGRAWVGWAR